MLIGTIDSNGICLVHQSSSICCGKLGSNLCRNTNINYYVSAFCLLALGIGDVSVVSNNGSGMSVSYCQLSELINKAKTTVYNGLRGCILSYNTDTNVAVDTILNSLVNLLSCQLTCRIIVSCTVSQYGSDRKSVV